MIVMVVMIGMGNIVGVVIVVIIGGFGVIFWMWIIVLFGMVIKYVEVIFVVKYCVSNENGEYLGGLMYYLECGLGKKWFVILFVIFGIIVFFGIGNMV